MTSPSGVHSGKWIRMTSRKGKSADPACRYCSVYFLLGGKKTWEKKDLARLVLDAILSCFELTTSISRSIQVYEEYT